MTAQMQALAGDSEVVDNPLAHKNYGVMNVIVQDVRELFKKHHVDVRKAFKVFDANNDGVISRKEFTTGLKALRIGLSAIHIDNLVAYSSQVTLNWPSSSMRSGTDVTPSPLMSVGQVLTWPRRQLPSSK